MDPTSIRLAGAVPLNPKPPAGAAAPSGAATASGAVAVLDVTEAGFETDVLNRSTQVPVVIDFWASWCGPCRQLSPILEKLAAEADGAWILAKIDVDANPRLAQAAQVQGIPAVKAVVNGQLVSEFTGAMPEGQVRQWLTQLLQATRDGQFGPMNAPAAGADDAGEPPVDPDLAAGDEAMMAGDLVAAEAAYRALAERPAVGADLRTEALAGLARVALLARAEDLDPEALQRRLAADPDDVGAATGMADALLLADRAPDAFALLLALIRRSAGAERDTARLHLISLFALMPEGDPAVARARRDLATALF